MTSPQPDLAAELARRLGVDDPQESLLSRIADAIADAEDDVVGYLHRPIRPELRTARNCWPGPFGWSLPDDEPGLVVVSVTPEFYPDGVTTTGTFTVEYRVGLDYLNDPALGPIRRYVRAAALNNPELLQYVARTTTLRGPVQSVSVSTEGQSKNVTYAQLGFGGGGQAASDSPGALPSLKTLDWWRRRSVHQAPDLPRDPRTGAGGGWTRDRDGFWNT